MLLRAMPSAHATHASHRALLRSLGLSVGIAIALSGCSLGPPKGAEAGTVEYSTIAIIIQDNQPGAAIARNAMADGTLTNAEYDAVIAADDARTKATCALAKKSIELVALGKIPTGKSYRVDDACDFGSLETADGTFTAFAVDGGKWDVWPMTAPVSA